jgi:phosphoglycolate phosphatase
MTSPLVIFDLDGTLVDTAPDLVATLNTILARQGMPPVAYGAARNMVGGGARLMLERGIAAAGQTLPSAAVDDLARDFIAHYADHIAEQSLPFDGVETALDALADRGFRLAICTNKLEWLTRRLLDALALTPRFAAICGADTFGASKPDPEVLHRTIERVGTTGRAVMVGDSQTDVAVARAAQVPVIGVDFGYSDTPMVQLAPDRVISSFADLPEAVAALIGGRTAARAGSR